MRRAVKGQCLGGTVSSPALAGPESTAWAFSTWSPVPCCCQARSPGSPSLAETHTHGDLRPPPDFGIRRVLGAVVFCVTSCQVTLMPGWGLLPRPSSGPPAGTEKWTWPSSQRPVTLSIPGPSPAASEVCVSRSQWKASPRGWSSVSSCLPVGPGPLDTPP